MFGHKYGRLLSATGGFAVLAAIGLTVAGGLRQVSTMEAPSQLTNDIRFQFACGPLSMITVMKHLGLQLSDAEKDSLIAIAGTTGTSFADLKRGFESYGLSVLAVEAPLSELKRHGRPALVHLNGYTFAAVVRYTKDGVDVAFPGQPIRHFRDGHFTSMFGHPGRALLVARSPTDFSRVRDSLREAHESTERTGLFFSRNVLAIGLIHDFNWETSIHIVNQSEEPTTLARIEPSCTCMTAEVDRLEIPPGQQALLTVRGQHTALGSFAYHIAIQTATDPPYSYVLPVRGYLQPLVQTSQYSYNLSVVAGRPTPPYDIPVTLAEGKGIDSVAFRIPDGAPFTMHADETNSTATILRCRVREDATPGWYSHVIHIHDRDSESAPTQSMRLNVRISPQIEPVPDNLYLSPTEFESWSRRVVIRSNDPSYPLVDRDFTLHWSRPDFEDTIDCAIMRPDNPETLTLELSTQIPRSLHALSGQSGLLLLRRGTADLTSITVHVDPPKGPPTDSN